MLLNFHDLAIDRDETLVIGLCNAARTKRMELREWIEVEVKALLPMAEAHELILIGTLQENMSTTVSRLRQIRQSDLPSAVKSFDDSISEISNGGYTTVEDVYDQLESGCAKLVQILKELHKMRTFIGDM